MSPKILMKLSILNLLLFVTATAALVALYASWQSNSETSKRYEDQLGKHRGEQAKLEQQLNELRQETGYLSISDPKLIHAVRASSPSSNTWRYRVYLPDGQNYYFASKINSLSLNQSLPAMSSRVPLGSSSLLGRNCDGISVPPGEFVVTLTVFESDGREWKFRLNVRKSGEAGNGSSFTRKIRDLDGKWPSVDSFNGLTAGGVSKQRVFQKNLNPCVLLDLRALSGKTTSSADSDQGALLWVGYLK